MYDRFESVGKAAQQPAVEFVGAPSMTSGVGSRWFRIPDSLAAEIKAFQVRLGAVGDDWVGTRH
jgi:hypothetical protein